MIRNVDIQSLERTIKQLELTLAINNSDAAGYRASIRNSAGIIESLEYEVATEQADMEENIIELNVLINADKDERQELKELKFALEYMKSGPSEPVKAHLNPRPDNENKLSVYGT